MALQICVWGTGIFSQFFSGERHGVAPGCVLSGIEGVSRDYSIMLRVLLIPAVHPVFLQDTMVLSLACVYCCSTAAHLPVVLA
jgi:hypothetical protein